VDQTKSQDQVVLWDVGERGADADLGSHHRLRTRRDYKGNAASGSFPTIIVDFALYGVRKTLVELTPYGNERS